MIPRRIMRPLSKFVLALSLQGFSQALFGQAVNGTLLGTVTARQQLPMPQSRPRKHPPAIHVSAANESGNYTFPDLQPGTYTVSAEAPGFMKSAHQNIELLSNTSTRVDLSLETGFGEGDGI